MIELYDATRLEPRRDPVLRWAPLLALAAFGAYGAHAASLQLKLQRNDAELKALQARLAAAPGAAKATPALAADLQRQVEAAEAAAAPASAPAGPSPAHWMALLEQLGRPDASLDKVQIDRSGTVRIEGRARHPQAVADFVNGWDRLQAVSALGPRAVELREDRQAAPLLRFQMQAAVTGGGR